MFNSLIFPRMFYDIHTLHNIRQCAYSSKLEGFPTCEDMYTKVDTLLMTQFPDRIHGSSSNSGSPIPGLTVTRQLLRHLSFAFLIPTYENMSDIIVYLTYFA